MSKIGGEIRETKQQDYTKKVGLFEANVIAINPTLEEYNRILGIELKEDSKAVEYLGESRDGNTSLRMDFWLEEVKSKEKLKVTFFLENKVRENKDGTKKQYINTSGTTSWAADENDLPEWFTKREYREAHVGEEELYNFLRTWLGRIDYSKESGVLEVEWKKLMKGNVRELAEQIDGAYCTTVVALATVIAKEKEGETKEYQGVYNKAFMPSYALKNFRLIDYGSSQVQAGLKGKKARDLKIHEKFVMSVIGEYGCKDYYILRDLQNYNPDDNFAASDAVISSEGDDY
jgi:hypothetical protein